MSFLQSVIIAIVQGLTEFLPVSSTGHQILTESFMGLNPDDKFIRAFTVCIQLGSILAVLVLYWKRFFQSMKFYYKLLIAFIPAVIFGLLFKFSGLEKIISNIWVVAIMLLLGGIVFLFVDKWFRKNETEEKQELKYLSAFKVGLFQCIAMIPGVSRSAATIIGGMTQKLNRKNAAEFSFFLAVPTLFAATALELYDIIKGGSFDHHQMKLLAVGNLVSFVVAALAIKLFISILTRYGFRIFGYYRIVLGVVLIVLLLCGVDMKLFD
jgi:undecaprenyl-diphosphatase